MVNTSRSFRVIFCLVISAMTASAGAMRAFPGLQPISLPKGDDISSPAIPLGFAISFLGQASASVYVNTNGAITFNSPFAGYPGISQDTYTGGAIPPIGSSTQAIIGAFLSDVDTSGASAGAITYGTTTLNGRAAFVVTYSNVTYFSFSSADFDLKRNSFQIVLVERSDTGSGNFDIELNYDQIQWETADSNGGTGGFGGYSATVGYSNGTRVPGTYYELPGSLVPGSYADGAGLSLVAGSLNSGVAGRYILGIRNAATNVSVTPASGSGAGQTFSFVFSDPQGAADIKYVNILFQTALVAQSSCFLQYTPSSNALVLVADSGSGYVGSAALGFAGTLSNTQCAVDAAGSSVVASGNNLTLNLALSFTGAFTGTKTIFMGPVTNANVFSGWQPMGAWSVPAGGILPPVNVSVTPGSGSGATQIFTFTFADASGAGAISYVNILIHNQIAAASSCFIQYARTSNALLLVEDSGNGYVGADWLGAPGTLANSQCALDAWASSVSVSGNNLTLSLALTFKAAFSGAKNVYMGGVNNAGAFSGWEAKGAWSASGPVTPGNVSVSPAFGTGAATTLSLVFSDAADINYVDILINNQIAAPNACFLQYTKATNALVLVRDSGSGYVGSAIVGAAGALANGQCGVNAAASSALVVGNELRLNLPMSFTPAFSGLKIVYMGVVNNAAVFSGWQGKGTWTAP